MRLRRFVRSERGTAMVEFAIVLPLLLLLVFGIVDFGRALFTLNNLTAAVREGGRYVSTWIPDPDSQEAKDSTAGRIQQYIQAFGDSVTATVTVVADAPPPNTNTLTVTIVNYPFVPITPLAGMIGLDTIQLSPSAVFRWEGAANPAN